jgi:uncharacterized protein
MVMSSPVSPATVPPPGPPSASQDEKLWGMLCHLSALVAYVGVPFGHIIGPLIVWLIKKDQLPLVDDQGKESLNFQISMTIYGAVSLVLALVVIGIFLLIALLIFDLVMIIVASIKANQGIAYRYPLTIRLIK